VVKLSGEADVTVSGKLRDHTRRRGVSAAGRLIIDLSALRFMDSSALHLILAAGKTLAAGGGAMALADPQRPVSTVLRLTQADQVLAAAARGHLGPARKDHSHRKTARGRALPRQRGVSTSRGVESVARAIGSLGRDPAWLSRLEASAHEER
jgi:anti-anti-sigma factor